MSKRILVVDDKANIRRLLQEYLTEQGYVVTTAENGKLALFAARRETPDLILLDIMMPEMDGYTFLQQYRQEAKTPIIFLTAKLEETDKVIGLELGADDYIVKPFSPRELVARVRAVLRRTQGEVQTPGLIHSGELEIDLNGHRALLRGEAIRLTRIEFQLLAVLAQHPGQTFSRAQLIDRLHGVAEGGFDRSIDAHIKNLRRKIEDDPTDPRYVLTVYGIGYQFTDKVGV